MKSRKVGGNQQKQRTITQREQEGECRYCGRSFTRFMYPGPNPEVCDNCLGRHDEIVKEKARERMRKLRADRKKAKDVRIS